MDTEGHLRVPLYCIYGIVWVDIKNIKIFCTPLTLSYFCGILAMLETN